jgi:chromosome segregation ATPase
LNRDANGKLVQVESLNMQLNNANKEAAAQALEQVQKQNEELIMQQSHWDSLRQAAEKIDALTNLIGQADTEDLKELRFARDRVKALEAEHATLQKRLKEAENKVSNSDRAASTVRQTFAQAQQRSAEWERRTKEAEGQLELTQTKLEQAEQTQAQLETDMSLARLQLEERDAEDRLAKVCTHVSFFDGWDKCLLILSRYSRIAKASCVTKSLH